MIDLSINVVTSYTDDIPVSGGPESFNGLSGMILQVADMISCVQLKKKADRITMNICKLARY
jgi:GLPGLI family protein